MQPVLKHPWNLAPRRAVALQRELAGRVERVARCNLRRVRLVMGTDVSYSRLTDSCYGAVVIWDLRRGRALAEATAVRRARFPYIPGLLSFREIPVLLDAAARLSVEADLILAEGQGLAHPRRFGLACHLGVLFDRPAVGCAKSRLLGEHGTPGPDRGDHCRLRHAGETVGSVLRTRPGVKPVFVSPGHRVSLVQCRRVVLRLTGTYRMPEPLRRAHALANRLRREHGG
jgi:deoxyribonuclease V